MLPAPVLDFCLDSLFTSQKYSTQKHLESQPDQWPSPVCLHHATEVGRFVAHVLLQSTISHFLRGAVLTILTKLDSKNCLRTANAPWKWKLLFSFKKCALWSATPQDLHCIHWSLPTSRPIIVSFLICTSEKSQSSWLNNLPPRGTLLERRVLSRPGLHVKASPSGKNGDKSTLIGLTLNQYSLIWHIELRSHSRELNALHEAQRWHRGWKYYIKLDFQYLCRDYTIVSESWNCEFSGKVVVLHEGNILALQKDPPLNPDTLEDSTKNARKMGLASRDATLNNSSYKGNRIIPVWWTTLISQQQTDENGIRKRNITEPIRNFALYWALKYV